MNLSYNHLCGQIPKGTQIQSFEASSFVGNQGLCGPPLPNKCSNDDSISTNGSTNIVYVDSGVEFDWNFVFTGVGFGVGSGLVVVVLVFWDKGRNWINNRIDKILLMILPMVGLVYTPTGDDEAEDDTEEKEPDVEEEDDHDNDEDFNFDYLNFREKYCIFCSKLDISMKKVIHDPRCTCHLSPSISTSTCSSDSDSS